MLVIGPKQLRMRRRALAFSPTAFRLTSSNGSVTYASFNAARTGDLAFAGALTWTVDQPGDGGGVDTAGMAYSSLLITVAPGIRHTGVKLANLSTVAHTTSQLFLNRPSTTIEWMTFGGDQPECIFSTFSNNSIARNLLGQDDSLFGVEALTAGTMTCTWQNCILLDDSSLYCNCLSAGAGTCNATLNAYHISLYSTGTIYSDTNSTGAAIHLATVNAVNCVSFGSTYDFAEFTSGVGVNDVSTCNTTNCVYRPGGRSTITHGTDTSPIYGSPATEFSSATDLYAAKSQARRNKSGSAAGVTNDILGAAFTTPPNVGASATIAATKLYFGDASVGLELPAASYPTGEKSTNTADITWSQAISAMECMGTTKGAFQSTDSTSSAASAAQQKHFIRMFASRPLNRDQTVGGGEATFNVADRENSLSANFVINMPVVYVWRPSTQAVVGYLADPTASQGGSEATAINQYQVTHFAFTTSAVAAKTGDLIICELWAIFTQVDATARSCFFAYGGTVETTQESTVVTDHASYLQLSEDISFGSVSVGGFRGLIGSGIF